MVGGLTGDLFIQLTSTLAHLSNITNHHLLGKSDVKHELIIVKNINHRCYNNEIFCPNRYFFQNKPDQCPMRVSWVSQAAHAWTNLTAFEKSLSLKFMPGISLGLLIGQLASISGVLCLVGWQPLDGDLCDFQFNLNCGIVNWANWEESKVCWVSSTNRQLAANTVVI